MVGEGEGEGGVQGVVNMLISFDLQTDGLFWFQFDWGTCNSQQSIAIQQESML